VVDEVYDDDDEGSIIDLLADIKHFCQDRNLCFAGLLSVAEMHYEIEQSNADEGRED
jgi:hypothetical protein